MQEEFAFYEVNDPFVQNFITSLDSILTSFKVCLHRLTSGPVSLQIFEYQWSLQEDVGYFCVLVPKVIMANTII